MLRRLFTLFLAVACACAPALAASAPVKHETADCCCAGKCPCAPTESTAPGSGATCVPPAAPAVTQDRAKASKPAPRSVRPPQHRLLLSAAPSVPVPRTPFAFADSPAAGVALFRAHCVFLI
ncbi:MAG: hypothetical protein JNL39_15965 [Opitutaceae bacterium]|nr:hypothetical protein [Opitutaceae bacterium]